MKTRHVSFDRMEGLLGRWDREELSTNRTRLRTAQAVMREAIGRELTERQRECVLLYYFQGLTQEEIAGRLGINKSTVCLHLQKARERLRQAVACYAGAIQEVREESF